MMKYAQEGLGVSPSMAGAEEDDILVMAEHLKANAPLGLSGKEALRMAAAQPPRHRIETTRRAIEITMAELIAGLERAA